MINIKLLLIPLLTIHLFGSDIDIHTSLDIKYKYMDIERTNEIDNEIKIYKQVELKPYVTYHNDELGISVKSEVVFRSRTGDGTIAPKTTSPFCPNFSYQDDAINSVYLNSLYVEKEFKTENTSNAIGFGLPPFSDGWPNEYRTHNVPRGTGLAPLVQMGYESIYFTSNFTNLTSFDNAQFMVSYGVIQDILPTNQDFNNKKYKDTTGLIAYLEIDEEKHKYKLLYQHDNLKFYNASTLDATEHKLWTLGVTDIVGMGYAYDNLDDNGNIVYNIFSVSHHTPNKESMSEIQLLIRDCIAKRVSKGILHPDAINEMSDTKDTYGWSNLIGFKQEFDNTPINKTIYLGTEWFTTSKNWFTKAVDTPNSTLYNLYTKGNIYTVYSGIYFMPTMSLNISYSRVENKWVNKYGTVNNGYPIDATVRDAYKTNNVVQIQYVWDF